MLASADWPADGLAPISLAELDATSALRRRVDVKYLVPAAALVLLAERLAATHRVLEVGGERRFTYRTTYFDSAGLLTAREHLQGRRRRFKCRRREYAESGALHVRGQAQGRSRADGQASRAGRRRRGGRAARGRGAGLPGRSPPGGLRARAARAPARGPGDDVRAHDAGRLGARRAADLRHPPVLPRSRRRAGRARRRLRDPREQVRSRRRAGRPRAARPRHPPRGRLQQVLPGGRDDPAGAPQQRAAAAPAALLRQTPSAARARARPAPARTATAGRGDRPARTSARGRSGWRS